jgi:hypothetical protein
VTLAARVRSLAEGVIFSLLVLAWWLAFLLVGGRDR